ncbi:hypothetical protein MTR_4g035290 [Medicago truncatula]|uniref:Uncharacterized protein n=1 Tax=Medicago truncatula TaxID=3880 RepID=G7JRC3_MEDTR|nr:hypothetical protein MTR_4g035290 [Medicago truncatula]
MEAAAYSNSNAEKNPKKRKLAAACPYLPDELWEIIFKFLNDGVTNCYLKPLSIVSKQFLSITNRLLFSIAVSDEKIPFLDRLFKRFPNLRSLDLSKARNLNLLLCRTEDFPLGIKSLNFSNKGGIHGDVMVLLSKQMKNLTSLICSGMFSIQKSDLFFIADCCPLLEELDLSYPMNFTKYDFKLDDDDHDRKLLALPKLRKINLSGNRIKKYRQFIKYLFKNCNLLVEVIMNDLIFMDEADSDGSSDSDSDIESDNDSDNQISPKVYTRRQRVNRHQQGTQHPRGASHPTVTTHPSGAGLRDVNQRGMTLGVETHPAGPRRATQEGTTGGERTQPLKPNNISSVCGYQ